VWELSFLIAWLYSGRGKGKGWPVAFYHGIFSSQRKVGHQALLAKLAPPLTHSADQEVTTSMMALAQLNLSPSHQLTLRGGAVFH
jgi:hypothetical protein